MAKSDSKRVDKMGKVARVNRYECSGCSLCTIALPEVFRLTPEGIAEAYSNDFDVKKVQTVIDDCPVMAIHWYNP